MSRRPWRSHRPAALVAGLVWTIAMATAWPLPAASQPRDPRVFEAADARGARPASAAAACPAELPARPLALQDVLSLALCASPQRQAAWAQVRAQQAQVDLERSSGRPQAEAQFGLGAGTERLGAEGFGERGSRGTRFWGWALRWEVLDFGRRDALVHGAWHAVRAALDSGDAVVQDVLLAAGTAYHQLVQAEGVARQLQQSRTATRQLMRQALRARGKDTLDRLGELQARTELARVQLELARAEADVELARAELARQLGQLPTVPLQVQAPADSMPAAAADAGVETLIAEALQRHPELLSARARVQSQAAIVEASRRSQRPALSLRLDQGRSRDSFGQQQQGRSIGLALNVPLADGGQRNAQVAQAAAELDGRQAELQALERQAALAVWAAHHALRTQARTLDLAQQMKSIARELLDAETEAFLAGDSDMFDVLDAQSSLDEASIELLTANTGIEIARLQLAAALGRLR